MFQYLINNLKISSRLISGFGLQLLLMVILGWFSLQSIINLAVLMNRVNDHPLKVIDATQQAKTNVVTIQRDIRDLTRPDSEEDPVALENNIALMDKELDSHMAVLRSQYLGPPEDIEQLSRALNTWRHAFDEAILLKKSGNQAAINESEPERRRLSKVAESKFPVILDYARAKAKSFRESAETEKENAISRLLVALGSLLVLGLATTQVITRSITVPLEQLRLRMTSLAEGDLSVEIPFQEGKTELTAIAKSVQVFKKAAGKLESQRWLKSTLSELATVMQTARSTQELADQAIKGLVPHLGGGVGVFYLWDDAAEQLDMLGSYGFMERRHVVSGIKLGDGLVGQCALERSTIVLTEVPEDYVRISSGIGEAPPRVVMVAPVLSKNKVLAVIEIGSFQSFNHRQQALIEELLPIIALNLEILERNNRAQTLLLQTQRQAEELQASEEELRTQSEQLRIANDELTTKTDKLQQQAEELRASEEELRAQREQLEESNKDLEEKSKGLEEQAKLLELARADADKRALERDTASRYKSEFLANMSHELRTPLNSLLILARSLRDNESGNLSEDQVESAAVIHESGTSLLRLINDILDLSKVEAGKMDLNSTDINLDQFAASLVQRFRLLAETKGLALSVNMAPDLPEIMHSDPGKLDQVINNLIGNAIKFTEQGSVAVNIKRPDNEEVLAGTALTEDQAVVIEVCDTGIGIPADKLESVFVAFEQVDGSSSRAYGGTGLGLTISRRLAQFLGGDIHAVSTEGQGSTFSLILPLHAKVPDKKPKKPAADTEKTKTIATPIPIPTAFAAQKKLDDDRDRISPQDETILVIEDDEAFAKIVRDLSRKRGFKCLVAEDGRVGLELAKRYRPTGIVLDVGLPQMDGWTVMERLKQQPETRHIPVHFMSATDSGQRGLEMGAVGYFTKPVSKEQIENAFERIRHFSSSGDRRVLVVDDDLATQKAVSVLLESANVEIVPETSGEGALARLENGELFDCMVLDLGLPGINGFNLLEECTRRHLSMPPVIVYSGRDLSEQDTLALQEYTDSIVIKGARSPERLLDEVTLFLHSVHSSLPLSQQQMLRKQHQKEEGLAERTVLIVDDDMRNTFALSKVLRAKGLNVLMAQDGLKALSQLKENRDIDLVLMDIMMPGMDGYDAIREIRSQDCYKALPIIALTAKAMVGDREKCLVVGANDYLSKPVDIDDLMAMMRRCLAT